MAHVQKYAMFALIIMSFIKGTKMKIIKAKAFIGLCQCEGCHQKAAEVILIKRKEKMKRLILCVDHAWEIMENEK